MSIDRSTQPGADEKDAGSVNRVELSIPARPELLFLARMTAAAVASRADFGYDQIEDLRLALDELCLALLQVPTTAGRLHLRLTWSEDAIEVAATLEDEDAPPHVLPLATASSVPSPNELSERILDALVDQHGVDHRDGITRSWLRMCRSRDR